MRVLTQPLLWVLVGAIVLSGLLLEAAYLIANNNRRRHGREPLSKAQEVTILRSFAVYLAFLIVIGIGLGVWAALR